MTDFLLARTWPERQRAHVSWCVRCFAETLRLVHAGCFGAASDMLDAAHASVRKLVKLQELATRRGIGNARGARQYGGSPSDPDSIGLPSGRWS